MPPPEKNPLHNRGIEMESVEKSVIVNVPVGKVYRQWAQIEDFPKFMPSVRELRRLDENHFHWRVTRGEREYDATFEIVLRIPERRIAWRTSCGAESSGVVSFEPQPGGGTRVTFKMKYAPNAGWDSKESLLRRLTYRLSNFKFLMEQSDKPAAAG